MHKVFHVYNTHTGGDGDTLEGGPTKISSLVHISGKATDGLWRGTFLQRSSDFRSPFNFSCAEEESSV